MRLVTILVLLLGSCGPDGSSSAPTGEPLFSVVGGLNSAYVEFTRDGRTVWSMHPAGDANAGRVSEASLTEAGEEELDALLAPWLDLGTQLDAYPLCSPADGIDLVLHRGDPDVSKDDLVWCADSPPPELEALTDVFESLTFALHQCVSSTRVVASSTCIPLPEGG